MRRRLQLIWERRSLHLAVDSLHGGLWWFRNQRMQAAMARTLVEATVAGTAAAPVWDRAPSHRDATVQAVRVSLIAPLSCARERNPAERVFERLRAGIEGTVYLA